MRSLFFIGVCLSAFLTPLPFFLFVSFLYIFFYTGFELLIIGVCIDTVFGTTATAFLYTLTLGGLIGASIIIKPYMSWYTTPHTP